jgi:Uma2 family endonuclease
MDVPQKTRYTLAKYLERERATRAKHEYFAGEVFAMGAASAAHNLIVGNLLRELGIQLKSRPYRVYPGELRIKVSASRLYTYADVVVACDPVQFEDPGESLLNPQVVVEVLSESSEAYDRGKKFEHYRNLSSLTDYVLVAQDKISVEHYNRQADGRWIYTVSTKPDQTVVLPAIECTLAVHEIYDKVDRVGRPPPAAKPSA